MDNQFSFKNNLIIPVSIIIAGIIIGGAIIYTSSNSSKVAQDNQVPDNQQAAQGARQAGGIVNVSADDDAFLGNADAPVTMIEFSDFQCPFCRQFWVETLPQIKKEYIDTGKVKFVYRDFPLAQIHPAATVAAQGAECAKDQGKYWEMHDIIFEEQQKQGSGTIRFTADDVKEWAGKISLNTSQFNQCLDSGKYEQEVEKDLADVTAAGGTGTPTFFINGRLLVGAQPFSNFKTVIEEELKKLE